MAGQSTSLTGSDTIKINGRILNDFADGNVAHLTFTADLVTVKTGKNGNSIYAFNNTGRQCDVALRLLRGSADDKYLNEQLSLFKNDPAQFSLLSGEFDKRVGDGTGAVTVDSYTMSGGAFKKQVDVLEDADGATDQAVAIYALVFSNAPRSIGQ